MSARAYVLLQTVDGDVGRLAKILRSKPGVVIADVLEGPPDVIMVVEASGRQKLAGIITEVMASVDGMVESIDLLPAHDEPDSNERH